MRYLKRMDRPLSITLVTGFLGSGKTTLIRRLLPEPVMRNSLIIVNDLAPIGLDQLLLDGGEHAPILLANGCICCTVNDDLGVTLLNLLRRMRFGELPQASHAIVETTGMADPIPIMRLLADNPALAETCVLERVVTLVDARHGTNQLARFGEVRLQVAVADFLLLGHADETNAADRDHVTAQLATINPYAELVPDARLFAADTMLARSRTSRLAGHTHALSELPWPGAPHRDITVACLTAHRPIGWEALVDWVEQLGSSYRADLLRIKGTVTIAGQDCPVFINGVQESFYPPILLPKRFEPFAGSQLVVIGRHLDPAALQAEFQALEG